MQHKKVDPFPYDIVGLRRDQFFKEGPFLTGQGAIAHYQRISYLKDFSIDDDQLRSEFPTLAFPMHMHGFMPFE